MPNKLTADGWRMGRPRERSLSQGRIIPLFGVNSYFSLLRFNTGLHYNSRGVINEAEEAGLCLGFGW